MLDIINLLSDEKFNPLCKECKVFIIHIKNIFQNNKNNK
jgi:hypothetical protein